MLRRTPRWRAATALAVALVLGATAGGPTVGGQTLGGQTLGGQTLATIRQLADVRTGTVVNTCTNPVLDRDLTGWGRHGTGATPGRAAISGHVVADFAYVQPSGNGVDPQMYLPQLDVTPGGQWTFAMDTWVSGPATDVMVHMQVDWYSSSGRYLGHTEGPGTPVTGSTTERWTRVSGDFTAPADAARANVTAQLMAPAGMTWRSTACDYRPVGTAAAPPQATGTAVGTCANPVVGRDLDGWGRHAGGAAPTRVAVARHAVAGAGAWFDNTGASPAAYLPQKDVRPGETWTFAVDSWVDHVAGDDASVRMLVDWYSATGAYLGQHHGAAVPVVNSATETWTRAAGDFTAPADAARANVLAELVTTDTSTSWIITACDYRPTSATAPPPEFAINATVLDGDRVKVDWETTRTDVTGWTVGRDGVDDFGTGAWSTDKAAADRSHTFNSLIAGTRYIFTLTPGTATGNLPAVTVTATPGGGTVPPPLDGWHLTFHDEFEGTSLDTTKWSAVDSNATEEAFGLGYTCFDPARVSVSGGNLVLSAVPDATPEVCPGSESPRQFDSGMVWTNNTFSQREGRYEVRMRTPDLQGAWPAFWTWSQSAAQDGVWSEIDIVEAYDYDDSSSWTDVAPNLHDVGNIDPPTTCDVQNFNTEMHTYAMEWKENSIRMYYDGVLCHEFTDWTSSSGPPPAPFDREHYLVLNLTVGFPWGVEGAAETVPDPGWTGSEMQVEYVRVWEEDTTPAPPPSGDTAQATQNWGSPAWSDDFDGTAPSANWGLYHSPGHEHGNRKPENCQVSGGTLKLVSEPNLDTCGMAHQKVQTHGRWEARVRSSGSGWMSLFIIWPDPGNWPDNGEYDWREHRAGAACYTGFLHYPGHTPQRQEQLPYNCAAGGTSQWHNIAFEWSSTRMAGWVDGVLWYEFDCAANEDLCRMPAGHLTFQNDNQGDAPGHSAVTEIDWVRGWDL
ncbi:family 16 glycosylhydrolase [Solwaraspora sp. WMMB335]|uniref:family 16 glycosylhydrolase n=1 Tax=Solwaraspora sp. WMMB335 TaxID=3404118 RepID=UPI003B950A5C